MGAETARTGTRGHVAAIVQQLQQLPTLSSVAIRLLELTSSETSSASEVVELISMDPSLSAKVLRLVRSASRGVKLKNATVHRAVVLLGFHEVRSAAVSVQVFELLDGLAGAACERHGGKTLFDRVAFWRHCITVACAAEELARVSARRTRLIEGQAFLAGLLHDLGQLALHVILPQTFDRICRTAEASQVDIDRAARALVGMDAHSVGRRLAMHWQLPPILVETTWLNGQRFEALPDDSRFDLVRIVTLADHLVRNMMISHLGHGPASDANIDAMAAALGIPDDARRAIVEALPDHLIERAAALGLGDQTERDVLNAAISRANALLENARSDEKRQRVAPRLERTDISDDVTSFLERVTPGSTLINVLGAVVQSTAPVDSAEPTIMVVLDRTASSELISIDADGSVREVRPIEDDPICANNDEDGCSLEVAGYPTAEQHLIWNDDHGEVWMLQTGLTRASSRLAPALVLAWRSTVGAAVLQRRAAELSEALVESGRALAEAQRSLADKRAMESLGEVAAGAAHEMNNPLAIISGRAQLLAMKSENEEHRAWASELVREAERLSDLITGLRLLAETPESNPQTVSLERIVDASLKLVRKRRGENPRVRLIASEGYPMLYADADHLAIAIAEILQNAIESQRGGEVELRVQTDPLDDRWMVQVIDSGPGLSERAKVHAFDPFFSEKPAGRQAGLGLTRARRLAGLNGGEVTLENGPRGGAVAAIRFPERRGKGAKRRAA